MHKKPGLRPPREGRRGRRRSVLVPAGLIVLAAVAGMIIAALLGLPAPASACGIVAITSATVLLVELCSEQGFRWYGPRWPIR